MKRTLLSLLSLVGAFTAATAQPVLNAANMNPVPGDGFYGHSIDTNVAKGPSGANVTWNFASVTELSMDSTLVYACDSTPYCSSFPGSNIAEENQGDYTYFNASTTKLSGNGGYYGGTAYVNDNSYDQLRYPFSYNGVYADTTHYGSASYDDFYTEIDSFIYDGYGTLVLPTGTDTGVVRIHNIYYYKDSSSAGVFVGRAEVYNWFKPGFHNAIFTISYDTTGSPTGSLYVTDATYYSRKANTTGVTELSSLNARLQVYPNPASDVLNIKLKAPNSTSVTVTITDLLGRAVATIGKVDIINGVAEISYSLSGIPDGIYIAQLRSGAGNVSQRFTVSK